MLRIPKLLKFLHTLSAAGLTGGLGCYMVLLAYAPQDTPAAYANLRQTIAMVSNYILIPSLAIALVSGLLAMAAHTPFMEKGWAWVKTAMGLLMFKGVLTVVGAKADHAASVSRKIAEGEDVKVVLENALAYEWGTLWVVMALTVANIILGVWRPRLSKPTKARPKPAVTVETDAALPETTATPKSDQVAWYLKR